MQHHLGKTRIDSLDIIRGVVVLAILLININYFSTIAIERYNPTSHGDFSGLNPILWFLSMTFIKQRFMTIFCVLFGAGVYLMVQANQNKGVNPTTVHYQRMFWLAIIGCLHAYLVWDGDILVSYALCGALVYLFRHRSVKCLMILGAIMLLVPSQSFISEIINKPEVTAEQLEFWQPSDERVQTAIDAHQGSWLAQTPARIEKSMSRQTSEFIYFTLWRAGGLMLIGMALMKNGFLTGQWSKQRYQRVFWLSFAIGVPWSIAGTYYYMTSGFSYSVFGQELMVSFYFGSLILALCYVSLLLLVAKSAGWQRFKYAMAAVGKLAITNYLCQNIIGTWLFFGYGLGLYGSVDRTFLIITCLMIWSVQIAFSIYWLKHFHHGPVEWLWRSLTYRQWQPWRRMVGGVLTQQN